MKLYLASKSPRRRELLTSAGYEFDIISSPFDETTVDLIKDPVYGVETIALGKAKTAFDALPDDVKESAVVLGADTIVVNENDVLLKPRSESEASEMLHKLSGKKHRVHTAVAIVSSTETESFISATDVYFYDLSDTEIAEYIRTGEPMDKAGSYGIQGKGSLLVKKIEGDYYNVVGLPIAETVRALRKFGIKNS